MKKILIINILYFAIVQYINAQQLISVDEKFQFANVLPYIDLYTQSDTSIDITKVLHGDLIKINVNKNADELFLSPKSLCYWADFKIENKTDFDRELLLEVSKPDLDHLQLFVLDSVNNLIKAFPITGDHVPFKQHPIDFRYFTFPLQLSAHHKYRYLMFFEKYGAFLQYDVKLYENQSYIEQKQWHDIKDAGYIALFFILTVIALLLFIVLKTRLSLYYFLYVLDYFFYWIAYLGWGTQIFWQNSLVFNDQIRNVLHLTGLLLTSLILKEVVNLAIKLPQWNKVLNVLMLCTSLIYLYLVYFSYVPLYFRKMGFITCWLIGTLLAITIFVIGIIHLIKYREKNVFLLLLAHFSTIIGTILFFLTIMNLSGKLHFSFGNFFGLSFFSTLLLCYIVINKILVIQKEHRAQQLALKEAQQRALSNIIIGQELERQQISQTLHDSVSVYLAALKMKISSVFDSDNPKHEEMYLELDEISEEVRNISHELSPFALKKGLLIDAIQDTLGRLQYFAPEMKIEFEVSKFEEEKVQQDIKKGLFFISQELLYNIVKHANATEIFLKLSLSETHIIYALKDNGAIYEMDENKIQGIGLQNIKSRLTLLNGHIELNKNQNKGMTRLVKIPLLL